MQSARYLTIVGRCLRTIFHAAVFHDMDIAEGEVTMGEPENVLYILQTLEDLRIKHSISSAVVS
jgi:hypothetical protein